MQVKGGDPEKVELKNSGLWRNRAFRHFLGFPCSVATNMNNNLRQLRMSRDRWEKKCEWPTPYPTLKKGSGEWRR